MSLESFYFFRKKNICREFPVSRVAFTQPQFVCRPSESSHHVLPTRHDRLLDKTIPLSRQTTATQVKTRRKKVVLMQQCYCTVKYHTSHVYCILR